MERCMERRRMKRWGRDSRKHLPIVAAVMLVAAVVAAPFAAGLEDANCSLTPTVRWSRSSDRLYLEGGGCTNLTAIVQARSDKYGPKGPLYFFHRNNNTISEAWTGDFFLNSSLYIVDNVRLDIIGKDHGGDVNRFLLRSDAQKFINVRAHGGQLMFKGVKVRSFDRSANNGTGGADKIVEDGRSYISAISEVIVDPNESCEERPKRNRGESRMDIIKTKITQLGYYASESYGVAYKVRGLCKDLSNLDIMDRVGVYGDIMWSELAYNYFGQYSYGHQGGVWSYNKVHHNRGYGFDPHDDSDNLTIHGNEVYKNGNHGIIASKRCDHVSIQGNLVYWNAESGIMLHRSCDHATVAHNIAYDNGDAGLALVESSYCTVRNNTFLDNTYGMRWSLGASYNRVYGNTMDIVGAKNPKYAIYIYRGNNEPDVEWSDGRPKFNQVYDNIIRAPTVLMKITEADDNIFERNEWYGRYLSFEDCNGNLVRYNSVIEDDYFEPKPREIGEVCFHGDSDPEFEPMC